MYIVPENRSRTRVRVPGMLWLLIAVNVAAYLAMALLGDTHHIFYRFGFIPVMHEPLTWLSHMFVHASPLHLLGNMVFLWMYGRDVEDMLGPVGFLLAYLASGLAAVSLYAVLDPALGTPLVGASGAISGVLGLYAAFFPRATTDLHILLFYTRLKTFATRAVWAIAAWLAYQVAMGLLSQLGLLPAAVAFWAHVGGLLAGLLMGVALVRLGVLRRYARLREARPPTSPLVAAMRTHLQGLWSRSSVLREAVAVAVLLVVIFGRAPLPGLRARAAVATVYARAVPAGGQPSRAGWTSYGGASDVTVDIAVDRSGDLWTAGWGGVLHWHEGARAYTRYGAAEGMPVQEPACIVAASDGSVWVGGDGGVARWDGQGWTAWTERDDLAKGKVTSLLVAPDGGVWTGAESGVSRFDGQRWTTFAPADGLAGDDVRCSALGPGGTVWFGTAGGVSCFDGRTWVTYADRQAYAMATGPDGALWVATRPTRLTQVTAPDGGPRTSSPALEGISRFDGRTWTTWDSVQEVGEIVVTPGGEVWAAGWGGLTAFDGRRWLSLDPREFLDGTVTAMASTPDGAVWCGTLSGALFRLQAGPAAWRVYDRSLWTRHVTQDGLVGAGVRAVAVASDGSAWFGTQQGLSRFDGETWATFTVSKREPEVQAVAVARDGAVWCATEEGVARFDGAHWKTFAQPTSWSGHVALASVAAASDDVWFGCQNRSVWRFDGRALRDYGRPPGPVATVEPPDDVRALVVAVAPDGALWCGGWEPDLYRFADGQWASYARGEGRPARYTQALAFDGEGVVWAGTLEGVTRFDGKAWTTYNTADGLPEGPVQAIAVDAAGAVWAGTTKGAYRFDGRTWTAYTTADGLVSDDVRAIAVAPDGSLWFGTEGGASHYTPPR